jgi:lactate dehydrogenase-like 2-hydroxyacid dehydrogenase
MKLTVLVTANIPIPALERVKETFELRHWAHDEIMPRAMFLEQAKGVEGIYCLLNDKIDDELLDAAGDQLKVVSTMSVGYDHVDIAACQARGVKVGHTPGVLTETTADLTVALLLATARRLPEAITTVKDGSWGAWRPMWMTGSDVYGSTVGIVGLGRIGVAVARRLQGFGCRLLYTDSVPVPHLATPLNAQFVTLDQLLGESDFVTLHCPLTQETRHLVNADFLRKMKPSAILINTSRGGVVNQDALYDALANGVIAAAGLDVTTPEPLPPTDKLLTLPNCVVLPHIASASVATRTRMGMIAAENLIAGIYGRAMPHPVN